MIADKRVSATEPPRLEDVDLDRIAQALHQRGLNVPALLLLQAARPLTVIASQLLLIAAPLLSLAIPPERLATTTDLLDDPQHVDALISRLARGAM